MLDKRFLSLIPLLLSGCLSGRIMDWGVSYGRFQVDQVHVAERGDMAAEGVFTKSLQDPGLKQFVIGSSEDVQAIVREKLTQPRTVIEFTAFTSPPDPTPWQMVPTLPSSFDVGATLYPHQALIPYEFEGKTLQLRLLDVLVQGRYQKTRALWSYPLQLLVIPAFAIDVVVTPFFILYGFMTSQVRM